MAIANGIDNTKIIIPVGGAVGSADLATIVEYGPDGNIPGVVSHGRIAQDGVSITPSTSTQTVYGWPYPDQVASFITDSTLTFSFQILQTQEDKNLEIYFGVTKNATTGGYHFNPGVETQKRQWFIDTIDKTNNNKTRWYFPAANVTERGEITVNGQGLLQLTVTFTAYNVNVEGEDCSAIFWSGPLEAGS
jgi:hypothetical protein